jgi:hypothetical protein
MNETKILLEGKNDRVGNSATDHQWSRLGTMTVNDLNGYMYI